MTTSSDTPQTGALSGPRHLRVGLLLRPRAVRVSSVAVAPGVPAQPIAAGHPWLAVVSAGDEVVHLARFQDPLVQRSTRQREGGDHHVSRHDEGLLVVSVPFDTLTDLSRSRIHLLDVHHRRDLVTSDDLVGEFRRRAGAGGGVRSVGFAEITATRDWPRVAGLLGVSAPPGAFEMYRDRTGHYRWRLRDAGGAIVAVSSEGFATRSECEAEVTWVRRHAAGSPTLAVDGPPPA